MDRTITIKRAGFVTANTRHHHPGRTFFLGKEPLGSNNQRILDKDSASFWNRMFGSQITTQTFITGQNKGTAFHFMDLLPMLALMFLIAVMDQFTSGTGLLGWNLTNGTFHLQIGLHHFQEDTHERKIVITICCGFFFFDNLT